MGKKDRKQKLEGKSLVQSQKLRGKEGFEEFYSNIFGSRWETLKKALFSENRYARIFSTGKEDYFLDPASLFCAFQLPLSNAERILDMCAAPGGKTLVISHRMNEDALLFSNERSQTRKKRLLEVCDNSLPEEIRERVTISCQDGSVLCKKISEPFDAILLDAPCSSERHVMADEKYLNEWSENRIKTLSMEQWALISSAYRLLSPGGYLLYSTCALCPQENDEIILRLLKKFEDSYLYFDENKTSPSLSPSDFSSFAELPEIPDFEKTRAGFHILPDKASGMGPIWFSLIGKRRDS